MKTALFTTLALFSGLQLFSQGCSEIFISEYLEGWSNNKAIELYNPTDSDIDLSGYRLERYSNGSTSAADNQKLDLVGTIGASDAFVIVIDKQDPDGEGQEAPVWEELADAADAFMCPIYDENNALYFNGNDAIVLRKIDGNVLIDVFGTIGEDPGEPTDGGGWNNVGPEFSWADNGGLAWSSNQTLVRKTDVTLGDLDPVNPFDVSLEWDTLGVNNFENLGIHDCACGPQSTSEQNLLDFGLFPNPSNGTIQLTGLQTGSTVMVTNLAGQEVMRTVSVQSTMELDLTAQGSGMYLVNVTGANGAVRTKRVTVQ